ncbi:MAG: phage tail tape measure protein [Synechococcales cyanobacterium CRU_2_2]|nr:phage tail tape measure protein [Synechococcales cyanobacterium CRU_2_2]
MGVSADTAIVGDAMTSVMNAYKVGADQADKVAAQMIGTVNAGKVSMAEYASMIGQVASVAAESSVPLDELNSIIAAATVAGVPVSSTMAGVKAAIAAIAKPTDDAAKLAKAMGVEFNMSALKSKGLVGVMKDIEEAGLATSDGIFQLFGSTEAWTALSPVFGKLKTDFTAIQETVAGVDLNAAFEQGSQSAAQMSARVAALKEELSLSAQTAIAPIYEAGNTALTALLQSMQEGGVAFEFLNESAARFRDYLAQNPEVIALIIDQIESLAQIGLDGLAQGFAAVTSALEANPDLIQEMLTKFEGGIETVYQFGEGIASGLGIVLDAVQWVSDLAGGFGLASGEASSLAENAGRLLVFAAVLGPVLSIAATLASIIPVITTIVGGVTAVLGGLASMGGVVAIVSSGFTAVSLVVGSIGGVLFGPIGLALAAIAGAIAGIVLLVKNWDSITAGIGKLLQWLGGLFSKIGDWIKSVIGSSKILSSAWDGIARVVKALLSPFQKIGDLIGTQISQSKTLSNVWSGLKNIIGNVKDGIGGLIEKTGEWLKGLMDGLG